MTLYSMIQAMSTLKDSNFSSAGPESRFLKINSLKNNLICISRDYFLVETYKKNNRKVLQHFDCFYSQKSQELQIKNSTARNITALKHRQNDLFRTLSHPDSHFKPLNSNKSQIKFTYYPRGLILNNKPFIPIFLALNILRLNSIDPVYIH